MGYGWSFRDGDWTRLRQIIQKIASVELGPDSVPTFGNLYLGGLTSGRVTYAGTLGLLQDSANFTFDGTNLDVAGTGDFGTLTIGSGSITDSSGAISFGNETLTTTGDATVNCLTWTCASFVDARLSYVNIHPAITFPNFNGFAFRLCGEGTGSPAVATSFFHLNAYPDQTNAIRQRLGFTCNAGVAWYIFADNTGAGTTSIPLVLYVGTNTSQLILQTDGDVQVGQGDLLLTAGDVIVVEDYVVYTNRLCPTTGAYLNIGNADEDRNYSLRFQADANSGILTWYNDEDYFRFADDVFILGGENIILDTTTGTKIGTSTSQLLGFYNATPVNQPDTVADAATQDLTGTDTVDKTKLEADLTSVKNTVNTVIDRLQELGLIA